MRGLCCSYGWNIGAAVISASWSIIIVPRVLTKKRFSRLFLRTRQLSIAHHAILHHMKLHKRLAKHYFGRLIVSRIQLVINCLSTGEPRVPVACLSLVTFAMNLWVRECCTVSESAFTRTYSSTDGHFWTSNLSCVTAIKLSISTDVFSWLDYSLLSQVITRFPIATNPNLLSYSYVISLINQVGKSQNNCSLKTTVLYVGRWKVLLNSRSTF